MKTAPDLVQALEILADPARAIELSRFFKTAPGQYGEGDIFWGLTVPLQRTVVKQFYRELSLKVCALISF